MKTNQITNNEKTSTVEQKKIGLLWRTNKNNYTPDEYSPE